MPTGSPGGGATGWSKPGQQWASQTVGGVKSQLAGESLSGELGEAGCGRGGTLPRAGPRRPGTGPEV